MRLLDRPEVVKIRRSRAYLGRIARGLVIDHWRRRDIEDSWKKIQAVAPEQAQPSHEKRLEKALLRFFRWLYSCSVLPATNCIDFGI